MTTLNYEDAKQFQADAYAVTGWDGVAWRVGGWQTKANEDTGWTGLLVRTGKLVMYMIGDDRPFVVDPDDVRALKREDFCGECGQIGCKCDGDDRAEIES